MDYKDQASVWDAVAVLTLFDAVNRVGNVSGNLMVQKLGFLAELEAQKRKLRAAHFRFFRYTMGPYSAHLANAVSALETAEIITRGRALTPRGRYVLDYARDAVRASKPARQAAELIAATGKEFGRRSGASLKEYVYELVVPVADFGGELSKVRDIPTGVDILDPARDAALTQVEPFDDDTLDELSAELSMSPETLNEGSASFRRTIHGALKRAASACP